MSEPKLWENEQGWWFEFGNVRGRPGQRGYGPNDIIVTYESKLPPTHGEAIVLPAAIAWTQENTFAEPKPPFDRFIGSYIQEAVEADSLAEIFALAKIVNASWELIRVRR